jgi:tetratricopeptide (TPR) repeat protein
MSSSQAFAKSLSCMTFNNAGIELLRLGQIEESMTSFVKALAAAKDTLRRFSQKDIENCTEYRTVLKFRPNVTVDTEAMLAGTGRRIHDVVGHCQQQVVYHNAFSLNETWFESLDYLKMLTISVAVVFNLALAHHIRAVACRDMHLKEDRLRQALCLYELAYSMQNEGDALLSVEFLFAISCNLGNIHKLLGDEVMTRRCFQQLQMLVVIAQRSDLEDEKLSQEATEAFTQCVCTLLLHAPAAPAA